MIWVSSAVESCAITANLSARNKSLFSRMAQRMLVLQYASRIRLKFSRHQLHCHSPCRTGVSYTHFISPERLSKSHYVDDSREKLSVSATPQPVTRWHRGHAKVIENPSCFYLFYSDLHDMTNQYVHILLMSNQYSNSRCAVLCTHSIILV